jgi:hypothetical protein
MVYYDPAWDMPQENWLPQSPFEAPQVPPSVRPSGGTPVCIGPIAREWLDWLVGAVDAGKVPASWIVPDDPTMYQVQSDIDELKWIIATQHCAGGAMIRFTAACGLETSNDGGVTWTPVPGWIDNFGNCVRSNIPPPIPPNPGGLPRLQHACNLAGFLAIFLIQKTMHHMETFLGTSNMAVQFATQVLQDLTVEFPALYAAIGAFQQFYNDTVAIALAVVQAVEADASFWSEVTCAIYNGIAAVGYVDASNFLRVQANLGAIVYPQTWAVIAIHNYWGALGLTNIQAAQAVGALDVVDCTNCPTWCFQDDFTSGAHGWTTFNSGGFFGHLVASGWTTDFDAGTACNVLLLELVLPAAVEITSVCLFVTDTAGACNPTSRLCRLTLGGGDVQDNGFAPVAYPVRTELCAGHAPVLCDTIQIYWYDAPGGLLTLDAVQVYGQGTRPAGHADCP